jgi:hypothetical protein
MVSPQDICLTAWRTNSRATAYVIERIPAALWSAMGSAGIP